MNTFYQRRKPLTLSRLSKLAGILAIFFLAACNTLAPEVTPDEIIPLDLTQVDIDLDAGTITGTTTKMEYSLTSTNGIDGTWTAASQGNTAVTFVEGDVYIREAANHQNVRLVKTIGPGMVITVNLDAVGINVAEGNITETITEMEYSLNSTNGTDGTWTAASNANTAVTFVAGKVYVREAAFHSNTRLVATIAPAAAAPTLVGDDNTNTTTGLTASHEYKIGTGEWTIGTTAPDLTGAKSIQIRVKATAIALASQIQTIAFTAGPILFDNFEGSTDLLTRGWTSNTGAAPSSVFALSDASPALTGSTQSLYIGGGSATIQKTFELTQDAVVEWKVSPETDTGGSTYIVFYEGGDNATQEDGTGVVRFNIFNRGLRGYPGTTTSPYEQIVDANTIPTNGWTTFRVEITGNTYKVFMNGAQVGSEYSTMESGARQKISRINFRNSGTGSKLYLDDIKITTKPAP